MEIILQCLSAVASYIFVLVIFDKLYVRRDIKTWLKTLIVSAAVIGMVVIGYAQTAILNFLYSIISYVVISKLLYKPGNMVFIVYDIIIQVIMIVTDMLPVVILAFIADAELNDILGSVWYKSAATLLNWILLFVVLKIFTYVVTKTQIKNIKLQELVFFIILVSGEIAFLYLANDLMLFSELSYKLPIILLFFLMIDLYIAYLLQKISESYDVRKRLDLAIQQSQMQLKEYNSLSNEYESSRRVIHDVRRHIASLEGLINSNNIQKAEQYKQRLNEELDKLVPQFTCDSPILTVIINNKLLSAKNAGIDLQLDIENSELGFISDMDITTIFSNLLDNAFEACEELPEDKRVIRLSVNRRNFFLFIYTENCYHKVNIDDKKVYKSTKSDHQGIGMMNIQNAVEKYGGSYQAEIKDDLFCTETLIPIPFTDDEKDRSQI